MQFSLFPWDRNRPRRNPPLADCVVSHGDKIFGLRAQNGILFFRDQNDDSKTWAIATPLPNEIENDRTHFEAFWRREFERGRVARYVVHFASIERIVPLFFLGDGTGWCREGWNRDDLTFSHSISMHDFLEGPDEVVREDLLEVEAQLELKLQQMPFPGGMNWKDDEERIEWLCGSREELERVAKWICDLEIGLWKNSFRWVEIGISAENQFARAHVREVSFHNEGGNLWLRVSADEQTDALSASGYRDELALSRRFWTLFDLALDQNTPAGLYWEYHDYGQNRTADEPHSLSFSLELERPSVEDRPEARAKLRGWMAPLIPAAEIEQILNDEAPLELPQREW